jgi:hypothetical protein
VASRRSSPGTGTPSCRRAPILTVERGESPCRHPQPCPSPTSAPSPLSSSSSYPPENPSRRPAATGFSSLGSRAGDAERTWRPRPLLPDHEYGLRSNSIRRRCAIGATPTIRGSGDQGPSHLPKPVDPERSGGGH